MTSFRSQRKKRKLNAEINVVPYVDVMLVLLVIFMVTAPMITQGVKVDLPEVAEISMPQEQEDPLIVSIDKKGKLSLNQGDFTQDNVDRDDLIQEVERLLSAAPEQNVLIHGDKGIAYEEVMRVMALLKQAGVKGVGLVTKPLDQ